MSDDTTPSAPTPPPSNFDPANPKASAKAAKAYAKATRPWYRKKRWWLLGVVVVVIVIAVATSSGGGSNGPTAVGPGSGSSSSTTGSSSQGGGSDGPGTQANPAKVGQTIQLAGTRYKVLSANLAKTVGGPYGAKADGIYIHVKLRIENMKTSTKTFDDGNTAFIAKNGTKYSTSNDEIYLNDSLILKQMQPNLPTKGSLLYDVPPSVVKTGVLQISDLWGGGSAYFQLGLK